MFFLGILGIIAIMNLQTSPSPSDVPAALAEARFRHSLWLALQHTVHRYLMSCASGRWCGAEKATRHIELCNHYVAVFMGGEADRAMSGHEDAWRAVHEASQALTDHLDEVIGFPLDSQPDYDALAPKFFAEFHRLAIGVLTPIAEQPPSHRLQRLSDMLSSAQTQPTLDGMHSAVVAACLELSNLMEHPDLVAPPRQPVLKAVQ